MKTKSIVWEMFIDATYFNKWAVRPQGDNDPSSPHLKHFRTKQEAEQFITTN